MVSALKKTRKFTKERQVSCYEKRMLKEVAAILQLLLFSISNFYILQVTELSPEETESVTGGYGKSISHVIIGLKTVKGTKQLKLDPTIYDALIKEKVCLSLR